jgi:hypothetical protein
MVRAIVAVGALSAMLVVAALTVMDTGADAQETPTETAPAATAAVERRDLASTEEFEGTLGYDDQRELAAQTTGTVTRLAAVGRVIANGEQLARIDEEPVILLRGRLAAYRDLTYGSKAATSSNSTRRSSTSGTSTRTTPTASTTGRQRTRSPTCRSILAWRLTASSSGASTYSLPPTCASPATRSTRAPLSGRASRC